MDSIKMDSTIEDDKVKAANDDNKKAIMVLGLIIITVVILALVTYLFFYNNTINIGNDEQPFQAQPFQAQNNEPTPQELPFEAQNPIQNPAPSGQEIISAESFEAQNIAPQSAPNIAQNPPLEPQISLETAPQESQIAQNVAPQNTPSAPNIAPQITDTITSLKYVIKPNDADIFTCNNMRNGRWSVPKKCKDGIIAAVNRLIEANSELIAIEVSGIVDSNPYAGPSAELKQEGLASFRAREAIRLIMRNFSDVAAFEGPSLQQRNKRGFQVKAYYLQK